MDYSNSMDPLSLSAVSQGLLMLDRQCEHLWNWFSSSHLSCFGPSAKPPDPPLVNDQK